MVEKGRSERQKELISAANELEAKGEPLPADLESAIEKKRKERERQRNAAAKKRMLEKAKRMNEGERMQTPTSMPNYSATFVQLDIISGIIIGIAYCYIRQGADFLDLAVVQKDVPLTTTNFLFNEPSKRWLLHPLC